MSKPLVEAMQKYLCQQVYPLHTPGHKGGRGLEADFADLLRQGAQIDVSLMDELDDLHNPRGVIREAQKLGAKLYGSDECFWCVNGTTQGIHAMLMGSLHKGDKILVSRNAHLSVFNGLLLAELNPVYLVPEFNDDFQIYTQPSVELVHCALEQDRNIKALLLTSPNYYGVCADLKKMAEICHEYGVLLLVDEAHGPHLGFSNLLPPSAMFCGADACAQSTHKLLGALTQASMLHVRSKNIDLQRMRDVMGVLTTTSPNYLLMASLDSARCQLADYGRLMAETALRTADKLRLAVCQAGLRVLDQDDVSGLALDRTKILVNLGGYGLSAMELAQQLRRQQIAVEMAEGDNILFLVTYADEHPDFYTMLGRLRHILLKLKHKLSERAECKMVLPVPEVVFSPRQAFEIPTEQIALADSIGRVAGEMAAFYPPGIPVMLPGEKITWGVVGYMERQRGVGRPVKGVQDPELKTIRVLKQ